MTPEINELNEVTRVARLLAAEYHDMTPQAINNEYGFLYYEYGIAKKNATSAIDKTPEASEALLIAINACSSAMASAEDCLELNYNRIATDL
jgi:Tol biopolymer transport system component